MINDEVDKFQPWSGRESDPISLGYARTQTYEGRRLIVNVSTPTTAEGLIWRRYDNCSVKLHFHVPCPHCGEFQKLTFSHIRWNKTENVDANRQAAILEATKDAWYECAHCREAITEQQRPAMIRAGHWLADGQRIEPDGTVSGDVEIRGRVGVHLWAGYCLWIPWHRIAAEFIRAKDDPTALMAFTNSWLGEPFRQQIVHAKASVFEEKAKSQTAAKPHILPAWTKVLLATADTQKDHFYYVIRAWGVDYRSQRIDHGVAHTFDELYERTLNSRFPWDGANKNPVLVQHLAIDSGGTTSLAGSRTHEVYRFALTDPARIHAMKGDSHSRDVPFMTKQVTYRPPNEPHSHLQIFLTLIDTNHFKDRLAHAINAKVQTVNLKTGEVNGDAEMWALNSLCDPDYDRQMASEHKVLTRLSGNRQAEVWMPVSSGAANHYWDCEVMQFALADMCRVDLHKHQLEREEQPSRPPYEFTTPDGRPFLVTQRAPIRARGPIRWRY